MATPSNRLPRSIIPVESVPMKLPSMMFPWLSISMPLLERLMTNPAHGAVSGEDGKGGAGAAHEVTVQFDF